MEQSSANSELIDKLAHLLQQAKLYGWELRRVKQSSDQLYLIFDEVESLRRVETDTVQVKIYLAQERDGQPVLGESGWFAYPGDNLAADLAQAQARAQWVANPPFTLPGPEQQYQPLKMADETWLDQPREVLWRVRDDLHQAETKVNNVRVASAEVFAECREISFLNHLGLKGRYNETELFVQFALLAQGGAEEAESLSYSRARFYSNLNLIEIVTRYGVYAQEGLQAELPPSGRYPVVFGEEALDTLFNYFTAQAGGPAHFQGWSRFKPGEPVIAEPQGDRLTLSSDPWLPGGLASRPFDAQGLALQPVTIIENNFFRQVLADKRYADYLQLKPTGNLTNLKVQPGITPLAAMLGSGKVLHLLRFSTLEPNPVTGAISGEIRSGYLIDHGQVTPIKGGSVSGRLDQAFRQATLSQELVQRQSYRGPAGVRLEDMSLSGA
ncbi:MAG: hypothetical protein JRI57_04130 [Deltaproteobacteria bacterium]|nr:hypothetical protein [Deltaproteobacteria bacterium]MBW1951658.1 hypothetical protein [Deltaproteobacteria bacterium]MBW1985758.1 hypothetical protein [Deltaproteobacteria bacterium]MBW2134671.1 hypothetical protein [Deltaproteobacteria bacterium]